MKSPIIYYGGKTSMLPNILPIIPKHDIYTEVFFGGGAVYWAKQPAKNETINDRLDYVINFYTQLKTNFSQLSKLIQASLVSRSMHNKALLILRNGTMFSELDRAWAFWYCSNFSYGNKIGGGLKYSNEQSMVVPRVMESKKNDFTKNLVERIENTVIENKDALVVLDSRNHKDAFHFIDPPYPGADMGHYKGYTFSDLENLLNVCEKLKGKFILCNYQSELLDEYVLKNKWISTMHTFRNKGMRKNNREKFEHLVMNFTPSGNLNLFQPYQEQFNDNTEK